MQRKGPSVLSTFEQVTIHYEIQDLLARYAMRLMIAIGLPIDLSSSLTQSLMTTVTGGIKSGVEEHVRYLQEGLVEDTHFPACNFKCSSG